MSAAAKRERDRLGYRRRQRLRRIGWTLMLVAAGIALEHAAAHLGAFGGQPSSLIDLTLGWPLAALIFIAGGMMAGQRRF